MDAYKDDRYSGLIGAGRWLKDKLTGMPNEVNAFYAEGKTRYLADMDVVIGRVADVVGAGLNAARARIAAGQGGDRQVRRPAAEGPPAGRQGGGGEALGQFEQLTADVDSKQDELVDALASKYVEARDAARRADRRDEGRQPRASSTRRSTRSSAWSRRSSSSRTCCWASWPRPRT